MQLIDAFNKGLSTKRVKKDLKFYSHMEIKVLGQVLFYLGLQNTQDQ